METLEELYAKHTALTHACLQTDDPDIIDDLYDQAKALRQQIHAMGGY